MTTMAEPEWDEATRELVLALDEVEICPLCGRSTSICQDPEHQEDWRAAPPTRCHATTAMLQAQKSVTEESNPQSAALLWSTYIAKEAP